MAAEQYGARPQNLILENRKRLSVSGVEEVSGFDDSHVRMRTNLGILLAQGEELLVESLSVETGDAVITGKISELIYEEYSGDGGWLSRLFGINGNKPA